MTKKLKNITRNFSLHNYKVVQATSFAAFIISATFTILLMTSQCASTFSVMLTFGMGILLEFAKSYFFTKGINGKNYKYIIRSTFLIVSIFLFLYSIVASLSFLQNENNRLIEPGKIANDKITKTQDTIKTKEILLANKKKSLAEYKNTSEQNITDLKSNVKALPEDYIDYSKDMDYNDVVRSENEKITQMTNTRNTEIDKRNTEIEKLTNEISSLKSNLSLNTEDNAGYTAFIKQVTNKLNEGKKSNLWTVDGVMTILLSGLSILFEIVAVLLYYSASTERKNAEDTKDKNDIFESTKPLEIYANGNENYAFAKHAKSLDKPKVEGDYKRNNIGFKHDSQIKESCTFDTRWDADSYNISENGIITAKMPVNTENTNSEIAVTPIRTKHTEDLKTNNTDLKRTLKNQEPCMFDTRKENEDLNNGIITKDIHFEITKEKIEKYIKFTKSCISDDGICPSNASMAKNTNLKYSEIRAIKNILKANGIIDIDEHKKRTILLRSPTGEEIDSWGWS